MTGDPDALEDCRQSHRWIYRQNHIQYMVLYVVLNDGSREATIQVLSFRH